MQLQTRRLELDLASVEETLEQIEAMSPEDKVHLSEQWLQRVREATSPDPWVHGFRMHARQDGRAIGDCGFKGPPDSDGAVEIAYHVYPDHESRGYATEAAAALTSYAFTRPDVKVVRAHTLPESNASTRVLTKCGFEKLGEVIDPDDGLVWRWEKHASETRVASTRRTK